MIALLLAIVLTLQFGQRVALTPAETLLEPVILRSLIDLEPAAAASIDAITGSDRGAGDIVISCTPGGCAAAGHVAQKLKTLVEVHQLPQPARTIRFVAGTTASDVSVDRVRAAIHLDMAPASQAMQVVRSPWSTASIADEVAEVFSLQPPFRPATVAPYRNIVQPGWDAFGVPTVSLVGAGADPNGVRQMVFVATATAYFLATLPNSGAEALLSHLMVGAHARLAEDGRRAVAQMGPTQRASAEVLILMGQAIDREQRRIRSLARFMPTPLDASLAARLADMEKAVSSVWTSLGITSSPFVPPAQRIRGRGGDDRRVPSRLANAPSADWSVLNVANSQDVAYEIVNFIDGKRTVSDIRDAVTAEFGPVALPAVVQYLEALAKAGSVAIK